ncbi:MAG: flavodoxin family protein [Sphaerochaeta sp.]|jgi:multimeric flavodoxin WrbA|nr:flavodoxin family protein [Sphaerochaeta sp.]MCH3919049.1 flavodoxin family protein [Sphaerochaeta sp.]MCI2075818.1 flavodoxin family protein [Sphaerochaeta sp.]MCI2096409.1 flavodoxin family protein [Sphaerochaeta sp.]MCI2103431.1 flavodoxin family protein [Sphaerochaeta sp.]
MKVLMLNGSPHEKGCTFTAMSEVESSLKKAGIETVWFHIGNTGDSFSPDRIKACGHLMETCDGLVVGSPVHYAACTGVCSAFLDRLFSEFGSAMRLKPACCVVSCRRGGASATFDELNKYFTISQMPVVSSQYWNSVHGNTPDEVRQDKEGMQVMRVLGANMAWLLSSIAKADLPKPVEEKKERTNFIR